MTNKVGEEKSVFVKQLEKLMSEHELSKRKLAEAIGVSAPTLCAWWPPHNAQPKMDTLSAIARRFKVSLNWLLLGRGEQKLEAAR